MLKVTVALQWLYSPEDTAHPSADGVLESCAWSLKDGRLPSRGPFCAPSCRLAPRGHGGGGPADVMFRKEALAVNSLSRAPGSCPRALTGCSVVQAKPEEDRKGRGKASREAAVELGVAESGVHRAAPRSEPAGGAVAGSEPNSTMHRGPEFLQNALF